MDIETILLSLFGIGFFLALILIFIVLPIALIVRLLRRPKNDN